MTQKEFCSPNDKVLPTLEKAVKIDFIPTKLEKALRTLLGKPGLNIKKVNIDYFHYKPFTNCRIVYRILYDDEKKIVVLGKINPPTVVKKKNIGKYRISIPDINLELRLLMGDRALPGLKHIMSQQWLSKNFKMWLSSLNTDIAVSKIQKIKVQVINYKPQSRCLLKIEGRLKTGKQEIKITRFAKVYASPISPGRIRILLLIVERFKNTSVIVPYLTGISENTHTLFFEAVRGRPLLEVPWKKTPGKLIRKVSQALNRIHGLSADSEIIRGMGEEIAALKKCVETLKQIDKKSGSIAENVYQKLLKESFRLKLRPIVTIHGDFSHEQILVKGNRISILDFDQVAGGDCCMDLGNFIANLIEARLSGKLDKNEAKSLVKKFVKEYSRLSRSEVDSFSLRWFTSAGLVKLAIRPLRRAEWDWKDRTKNILKFAWRTMNGEYDYLFPTELQNNQGSRSFVCDFLQKEIEDTEIQKKSTPMDDQPVNRLKKIWPPKINSWILLYSSQTKSAEYNLKYKKINNRGRVTIRNFLNDAILKNNCQSLDKERMKSHLKKCLPVDFGLGNCFEIENIKILSYKPENRCLIEYKIKPDQKNRSKDPIFIFGKFYRSRDKAFSLFRTMGYFMRKLLDQDLNGQDFFPEPAIIPELNAVFYSKIPGRDFLKILKDEADSPSIKKIAFNLFSMHAADYQPSRVFSWENELDVITHWMEAAKKLYPAISSELDSFFCKIREWGEKVNSPAIVCIHRDFYDKQILVGDKFVNFLDFDSIALGDPALDVGNFVAHLVLRGIQFNNDPDLYLDLIQKFINTYKEWASNDLEERIDLYTTSSLLRLSCVYLLRPEGRRIFYPLLWQGKHRILLYK